MSATKNAYASSAVVRRAISAVKSTGMIIGGVELLPDGTVRLVPADTPRSEPANEFDKWDAAGQL
ncbi:MULTISPECIES: hypothetical protein [unclassified Sphingopyxis]|uniref:hypothetical protein n=1 Tax=unclassified Sphingopyxis TaxID=2614943 RepID=UPI0012E342D4|nr:MULTISPECIES: hypothetical protein [unclassified Sphingopyxis]